MRRARRLHVPAQPRFTHTRLLFLPLPSRAPRAAFAPFAVPGARLFVAKAIYVAINLGGSLFMLWKLRSLGVLPATSADWVHLLPPKRFLEFSSGAFGP
jgi:hypothetical protein